MALRRIPISRPWIPLRLASLLAMAAVAFHGAADDAVGQVSGNHLVFARATWYRRLKQDVVLTRGFFAGASLEAGNAWVQHQDISLRDLLVGSSVFVGADTGVGPMYLGLTWAPRGSLGLVFFIGRP